MRLKDIIKYPTTLAELENESFCIDYTNDYEDDDFWGCGLISNNSTDQNEIDVNVKCEDSNTFVAFVVFETDQIYNDNKDFFNKCLKDMGFHRTKNREVVEFKQIVEVEEGDLNSDYFQDKVQEVSKILVDELFNRMENAGIKSYDYSGKKPNPDKDDEELVNDDFIDDEEFKQKITERENKLLTESFYSLKTCLLLLENNEGIEALNKIQNIIFKK